MTDLAAMPSAAQLRLAIEEDFIADARADTDHAKVPMSLLHEVIAGRSQIVDHVHTGARPGGAHRGADIVTAILAGPEDGWRTAHEAVSHDWPGIRQHDAGRVGTEEQV